MSFAKKKTISLAVACALPGLALAQVASLAPLALPEVSITAARSQAALAGGRLAVSDTASLLAEQPGLSVYTGGGVSGLPVLHGLNDDRVKVLVDGMEITSACANHMNPALSYIGAAQVDSVDVIAGITPVSQGGDSIAGTIAVRSARPVFAQAGEGLHQEGSLATFYRSNGRASTVSLGASVASENLSLGFSGAVDRANSYTDGHGTKVRSTQYQSRNQALTLGFQGDEQLLTVKLGQQTVPYQGYVNQYMDMVGNHADFLNLDYRRRYAWGKLDARFYWQDTKHEMGFFSDEKKGSMPMNTHGKDIGYALQAELPVNAADTLRLGHELHRFTLDDWWPPVAGSTMMGPNTYQNINNGQRDRLALFAEWDHRWSAQWSGQFGIRDEVVKSDAGQVQAYDSRNPIPAMGGMGMANPDATAAAAFNARDRSRRDNNVDLTALARYQPSAGQSLEFGYGRKTRSPNLYERYSWGVGTMAMTMAGWFGDGNGYVGNPDLKPEVAHTLSLTAGWQDSEQQQWALRATPYYTYVHDYIGVDRIGTFSSGGGTFAKLQFANHNAKLYGVDLSGKLGLWDSNGYGRGQLKGVLGYVHGERTDGGSLYHLMPLNLRLSLEQRKDAWTNVAELQVVDRKSQVDALRNEPQTKAYALVNLRSAYQWSKIRLDVGVSNLFNKYYALPLGGVDLADWKAGGKLGQPGAVAGIGRSLNVGLTVDF
jgi:iron complex outermembrane receptor protein